MSINTKLIETIWDDEEEYYAVYYDGHYVGTTKDEEEAYYLAIDYEVGRVEMYYEEER